MQEIIIKITDDIYPVLLKQIKNPPQILYAKGNIELLSSNCIAIVGSRICTNYGEKYAEKFAYNLAKKDITIVSGMALGIDTKAHIGAINANGKTIAVLRKWTSKYISKRKYRVIQCNNRFWRINNYRISTRCKSKK